MIEYTDQSDDQLRAAFQELSRTDQDYWSFKGNSKREHSHGLFQYPAMMVPQMVGSILQQACTVHPEIRRTSDPFAGSGTILTESMLRGLSFSGTDINPLAVLLCRVKSGPFFVDALIEKANEVIARIKTDKSKRVEARFPNRDKWFRKDVQIALSRVKRSIMYETSPWARRFFWIGLAEAVRFTSNSRTSTYKLHTRTPEDILKRKASAIEIFEKAITRNLGHMKGHCERLKIEGHLDRGIYNGDVSIDLGDTSQTDRRVLSDIVLTSPPYGDNTTTVPYGQYSYLPLQWIDMDDIHPRAEADYLDSAYEIDARSLGGSKRIRRADRDALADRSISFRAYIDKLKGQRADRCNRVVAYFRDLDGCIEPILNGLFPRGLMVWTLGNRKVGGERVPLDCILSELLSAHQSSLICELTRTISSKRMASKNNVADTMSSETILVMRKGHA